MKAHFKGILFITLKLVSDFSAWVMELMETSLTESDGK
jgi:hypothetical protein